MTTRQRVLARGGSGRAPARPALDVAIRAYLELAKQRVTIPAPELDALLAARFGLASDDPLFEQIEGEITIDPDSPLTMLPPDVVVHGPALMAEAVLTHRLSEQEREEGYLVVDTDLAGFARVPDPRVGEDEYLDLDEGDDGLAWFGPDGWLAELPAGALLAVQVAADGLVTLSVLDEVPTVPPGLVEQLRAVYDAELEEPGLPVAAEHLLLGVRLRERAAFTEAVPPLEDLAAAAGLQRRGPEFAHAESVWANGAEADRHWRLIERLGTDGAATAALEALDLIEGDQAPGTLRRALELVEEPDVVAAVTEELLGEEEEPARRAAFVALADRMVAAAGRTPRAAVARWMAAVAAERDGRVLDAESHLRAACSEAEGWPFVEDRLAWFEADRGDAAAALGRWRAIGTPDDDPDVAMVLRFAAGAGPEPGRNDPCSCGSGRKYKQCHLGRPVAAPLPERVGWLWRKAVGYLERRGGLAEYTLEANALMRAGEDGDVEAAFTDPLVLDVALHEEGWFARFLRERGPLLPVDEARLGASWLEVDRTVFEVLDVRPGAGLGLRDLRTDERVDVTERTASVEVGALICARAVPDGVGHQLVGAVVPVAVGAEGELMESLEVGDGLSLLAWSAGTHI